MAKVADIISDNELAFNAGSEAGVEEGSFASVQRNVMIKDPDTQEELGSVLVGVLRLRIHLVEPKFSVGSVSELQETGDSLAFLTARRYKKIVQGKSEEKSGVSVYVKRGDIVTIGDS
jgi:hypothetical protein